MDTAYDNALKRKKELEAELQTVTQFLSMYQQFSTTVARPDSRRNSKSIQNSRRKSRDKIGPAEVADMMERVLKESGQPLPRSQLADEIERHGIKIPSAKPATYVGTVLWRNRNRFESIEGRGYWLKGAPVPDPGQRLLEFSNYKAPQS